MASTRVPAAAVPVMGAPDRNQAPLVTAAITATVANTICPNTPCAMAMAVLGFSSDGS